MHQQAQFSQTTQGNSAVLTVSGELDISNRRQFMDALGQGLEAARESFVVDLRNLSYLDSTGIVCLIQAHKHTEYEGKTFSIIIEGDGQLKRLFDITGLSSLCTVRTSQALRARWESTPKEIML